MSETRQAVEVSGAEASPPPRAIARKEWRTSLMFRVLTGGVVGPTQPERGFRLPGIEREPAYATTNCPITLHKSQDRNQSGSVTSIDVAHRPASNSRSPPGGAAADRCRGN